MSDLLARTAKAIHTLFYATEQAAERRKALRASLSTEAELAAYDALSVAMINFNPLPPQALEGLRHVVADTERHDAEREAQLARLGERITIEPGNGGADCEYVVRLLKLMYSHWDGTLDYERGVHRFCFHSQADEKCRRVTVYARVVVDGETSDFRTRSYMLAPYLLVVDHRTQRESSDPWKVLSGDLSALLPESGT